MKRVCTEAEKKILLESADDMLLYGNENKRKGIRLPDEQFSINGGTIIECAWDPKEQEIHLVFAEDDFKDLQGRNCCFYYPVSRYLDLKLGDRILVVQGDSGIYFPMLLNEKSKTWIPVCPPEEFYQTNWSEVNRYPHPMAIQLKNDSVAMDENDKEIVREHFRKVGKLRGRDKVGAFLAGVAAFITFGVIFCITLTDEMIEQVIPVIIGMGLVPVLSVAVAIGLAVLLKTSRTRPISKLKYQKKVLLYCVYESRDYMSPVKILYVFEKIDNKIQVVTYPIGFNNFVPKDMYYGQILHKCTKEAAQYTEDMKYFY